MQGPKQHQKEDTVLLVTNIGILHYLALDNQILSLKFREFFLSNRDIGTSHINYLHQLVVRREEVFLDQIRMVCVLVLMKKVSIS